ncbi:hypothetical protein NP493_491g00001 [Ridgeia piscesae]|uniref:Uncharacterized protein n=1 Tax=Ridgeia piscesae TaxID=27915 RepID=A0AAD9KXW1_RIDPI|nr:hypothetical protein NP493_491g00001 [Ridgeia piscesae]
MSLRHDLEDRDQEVHQIREKAAAEIADLEGIAQVHYSRANRLGDELNYLRAEHLEIARRLQSQEELSSREHKLEDTLRELKDDIKTEVTEGMLELERSRIETATELEQLHDQKDNLQEHLSMLKHTRVVIRNGVNIPVLQDTTAKSNTNYFEEQQYQLKVLCQSDSHRPTTPSSDVLLNRSRTSTPAGEFDMQVRE